MFETSYMILIFCPLSLFGSPSVDQVSISLYVSGPVTHYDDILDIRER